VGRVELGKQQHRVVWRYSYRILVIRYVCGVLGCESKENKLRKRKRESVVELSFFSTRI
jgi:hypothetical protein